MQFLTKSGKLFWSQLKVSHYHHVWFWDNISWLPDWLIDWPIYQPASQLTSQPTNRPINWPTNSLEQSVQHECSHTLSAYFFNINFIIILSCLLRFSTWSHCLKPPSYQNSVWTSHHCTMCITCPTHLMCLSFIVIVLGWGVTVMSWWWW